MKKISVTTTKDKEVVDITDEINTVLTKSKTKMGFAIYSSLTQQQA